MKGKTGFWLAAAFAVMALLLALGSGGTQTASQEERRIAEVLSAMEGAGEVEVALFYSGAGSLGESSAPTGAVVVAEGAQDLRVRLNLIRAMRTLLGLTENAVDVFAMEGKEP
ncbi:MAG: hypothetical protein J6K55_15475 [Clostridia bacterium]|nr:hypothetical protein [Clostridia bacterium]